MNENKLKDVMNNYEIKTTSAQILKNYVLTQEEKTTKKTIHWWKGFSIFATICSVLFLAYFMLSFKPNTVHEIQDDSNNNVAFQLLSGIELSHFVTNQEQNRLSRKNKAANDEEFEEIVEIYDKASDLVQSSYLFNKKMHKKVYEGKFKGKFKEFYPYKMEIKGNEKLIFYYDGKIEKDDDEVEMEIHGEIYTEDQIYKVYAETESSTKEKEYEITIFFDEDNFVEIEQQQEEKEFEYKYNLYKNKDKITEIEFSSEEQEQELSIKDQKKSYEFVIKHLNEWKENIFYHTSMAEGMMELTYEKHKKIYVESETQKTIIKNFQ